MSQLTFACTEHRQGWVLQMWLLAKVTSSEMLLANENLSCSQNSEAALCVVQSWTCDTWLRLFLFHFGWHALASCSHTFASDAMQYDLVPAKLMLCVWEVNAGIAHSTCKLNVWSHLPLLEYFRIMYYMHCAQICSKKGRHHTLTCNFTKYLKNSLTCRLSSD